MRFKKLLGLLAIGGAVAYAQKKRGGELSVNGLRTTARELFDRAKARIGGGKGPSETGTAKNRDDIGSSATSSMSATSDLDSPVRSISEDYGSSDPPRSYGGNGTGNRKL